MKLSISAVVIALLFFSCSDKVSKPDNLISEERMANIIYDVSILTAAKGINKGLIESNGIFPEEFIYLKYNIDSLQFVSSLNYYTNDLDTYDNIYTRVGEKIKAKKESLEIKDSTKQVKKDIPVIDKSANELTSKDLNNLSDGLNIKKVGLTIMSTDIDYEGRPVIEMTRNSIFNSAYAVINDINIDSGDEIEVSVFIKKPNDKSAFGLRISGVYPNRVDAVFDLNKNKVKGTQVVGYFESAETNIKIMENNWLECKIKAKANIDKIKIIFGPTDMDKATGVWEGKSEIPSHVNSTIPTFSIN